MRYILIILAFIVISGTIAYQGVRTDGTLTGSGITGDELGVDTGRIATKYYAGTTLGGGTTLRTISPAQITSDQDNYSPTGIGNATYLRISGDNGIRAITGITDSTAGVLEKTLINVGSYPIYFPMDHPDSDAAHRFTGHPNDFVLHPGMSCNIWYDLTSTKWRIIVETNTENKKGVFYSWYGGTSTAGDNNDLGFTVISSGSVSQQSSSTSLPGYMRLSSELNSAGGGFMYFIKTGAKFTAYASAHIYVEALVSIPTLSDGTETFASELQIFLDPSASTNLEENNTIGIRYSHGINSGKWELFSQNNAGTESTADCGVTVATATLYKLRIEYDKSATEARAYINNAYVGRITTNLPTANACGSRIVHKKSAGTTARYLYVHNHLAGAIYQ